VLVKAICVFWLPPGATVKLMLFLEMFSSGAVLVFEVKPAKVLAFAKGTFGQTRHRFSAAARPA